MSLSVNCFQRCISPSCGGEFEPGEPLVACPRCGSLLDVQYRWEQLDLPEKLADFEAEWSRRFDPVSFSGIWRFHRLLPFADRETIVTIGEGQTLLQQSPAVSNYVGVKESGLYLQYEGMNPSGRYPAATADAPECGWLDSPLHPRE